MGLRRRASLLGAPPNGRRASRRGARLLDGADVLRAHHHVVEPDAVNRLGMLDLVGLLGPLVYVVLDPDVVDLELGAGAKAQPLEGLAAGLEQVEPHAAPGAAGRA